MRRVVKIIAFMVGVGVLFTGSVSAEPLPVGDPPNGYLSDVFITGFQTDAASLGVNTTKLSLIELYNTSSIPINLQGWSIEAYAQDAELPACVLTLPSHYILSDSYAPIAQTGTVQGDSDAVVYFSDDCVTPGQVITTITLKSPQQIEDTISAIPSTGTFIREGLTPTYRDVDPFSSNFISLSAMSGTGVRLSHGIYSGGWYQPPTQNNLKIIELYPDAAACPPNDTMSICVDYVKLYNPTAAPINLNLFRLRTGAFGSSATPSTTISLNGILGAEQYISVPLALSNSGNWVWLEDQYGVKIYDNSVTKYPSATGHDQEAWSINPSTSLWQWSKFPTPGNEPNRFAPGISVNLCSGLRISEIAANSDGQFIEVLNTSREVIDISGCQLQTNRSQSATYVFSEGDYLKPGEFRAIDVAKTPLTLTKTTSGTVYIITSDGSLETDSQDYADLKADTSWAEIDGVWRQTYQQTPGSENIYLEYPACTPGYFRNTVTGNCNKIAVSSSVAPCASNQYRSPDTNRCRLLSSTVSSLQSCAANQYRNPETNRCRLLASTAASSLTPCLPSQERNPDTNRCRKSTDSTIPKANYALEDTTSGSSSVVSWTVFAAVGGLALGYGAWEWRREITGLFSAIVGKIKG